MAGKVLQITYVGDAKSVLKAQQQIAGSQGGLQGNLKKTAGIFQQTFGVAAPLSIAAAGAAVVQFTKAAITAAADQEEAVNKSAVIFGRSADEIAAFSDSAASSLGISKTAALEAAAGFGAMLQTAGLAEQESANMSQTLVQLAADMASFNNQDPSAMLERLRSGLAGEAEPLRQFGVFLSEAAVKAKAMELGIGGATGQLTEAEKVQARYAIILEQTSKQQGDFARTSDGLANSQRVLAATVADLEASIGRALLPAAQEAVTLLTDLVRVSEFAAQGFKDFDAEVQKASAHLLDAGAGMAGFAADALLNLPIISDIKNAVDTWRGALDGSAEAAEGSGSAVDALAAHARSLADSIRSELVPALDAEIETHAEAAEAAREQRQATLALTNEFVGLVDSAEQVAEAQRTLNELERKGKTDTKAYEQAVIDAITAQAGLEAAVVGYAQELVESGKTQGEVEGKVRQLAHRFGIQDDAIADLIERIRGYINNLNAIPRNIFTTVHLAQEGTLHGGVTKAAAGFHGEVRQPTVFLTGEAGPERVDITPARVGAVSGRLAGSSQQGTVVNNYVTVNGWVGSDQQIAQKITEEQRRLQRQGNRMPWTN
jgi:hypothetical protein